MLWSTFRIPHSCTLHLSVNGGACLSCSSDRSFSHIAHIYMVSHLCESVGAFSKNHAQRMISRTHHRRTVFPLYVCVSVMLDVASAYKCNHSDYMSRDVRPCAFVSEEWENVWMHKYNRSDYKKTVCFLFSDVCSCRLCLRNLYHIQWVYEVSLIVYLYRWALVRWKHLRHHDCGCVRLVRLLLRLDDDPEANKSLFYLKSFT